jgi:hypothetical protein
MRKTILLLSVLMTTQLYSQSRKHELSLVFAPIKFNEKTNYGFLYRFEMNDHWKLRTSLGLNADATQEIRQDTQQLSKGIITIYTGLGIQRELDPEWEFPINLYIALDLYWNSEISKKLEEHYYYYYANYGAMPIIGLSYEYHRIILSFESRANLNLNFQSYDGNGANYDRKFSFRTMDQMALGLGFKF